MHCLTNSHLQTSTFQPRLLYRKLVHITLPHCHVTVSRIKNTYGSLSFHHCIWSRTGTEPVPIFNNCSHPSIRETSYRDDLLAHDNLRLQMHAISPVANGFTIANTTLFSVTPQINSLGFKKFLFNTKHHHVAFQASKNSYLSNDNMKSSESERTEIGTSSFFRKYWALSATEEKLQHRMRVEAE